MRYRCANHPRQGASMNPLERLRHHVSGAIERGESVAIVEQRVILTPSEPWPFLQAPLIVPARAVKPRRKRKAKNLPDALL